MNARASLRMLGPAVLFAAAASRASVHESLTPQELARRADDVAHVRVVSIRNEMGSLPGVEGVVPLRRLELEVIDAWRGRCAAGDRVDVLVPGGTAPDGTSLMVSSSPSTDGLEGHEAVVFVRRDAYGSGRHGFEGGWLGLYRVDAPGRRRSTTRVLRGQLGSPFPLDVPIESARKVVLLVPTQQR